MLENQGFLAFLDKQVRMDLMVLLEQITLKKGQKEILVHLDLMVYLEEMVLMV